MLPKTKSEKPLTGRQFEDKALFQDKINALFD